jgi:hypothetical protein
MKKILMYLLSVICILFLITSSNAFAFSLNKNIQNQKVKNIFNYIDKSENEIDDYGPGIDIKLNITIKKIRALDRIDLFSEPDFYVKLFVNNQVFTSKTWYNQKVVNEDWSTIVDVPDEDEKVIIIIQLWDKGSYKDRMCDLSENNEDISDVKDITITYSLKTGHWRGEDYTEIEPTDFDPSGYGRLNGCDDNSIYQNDLDCELWFDITQNDKDGDGIPYWTEVFIYKTDPEINDLGSDEDKDGIPIEWEHKWGHRIYRHYHTGDYYYYWHYHPFEFNDHKNLDPDRDGLTNYEEYLTSQWGSDPFREDLFIELDQMAAENKPNGRPASFLPEGSKELLKIPFHRRNIIVYIDDGCMGGGELIPFDDEGPVTNYTEIIQMYEDYFLHGDENNWRRGVFRYGMVIWDGNFSGYNYRRGAFQISKKWVDRHNIPPTQNRIDTVYASVYMHELGHALGINSNIPGGHDRDSYYPWQLNWWKFRPYKSCMNYGYTYFLVDYSDGSRGKNDHDDWSELDLAYFQRG